MSRRLCAEDQYPAGVLAAAGFGLSGEGRRFARAPLSEAEWPDVRVATRKQRVSGSLCAAIRAGELAVTGEQRKQAETLHRIAQLRVLTLERTLVDVVDRLTAADIEARVLKGSAVAHLDYPDPGLRSYHDVDILVRADDFSGAVESLRGTGFERTLAEPRPGFDRRFDKGTTMRPAEYYEVDLHRTLVLGPWGRLVDFDDLWEPGDSYALGERTLTALSPVNRFLHACYHAALGDWPLRLGSLRDVAELLRKLDDDPAEVLERAGAWGVNAVVAAAVADTRRLLGGEAGALSRWAQRYVPSRREESWLALHTRTGKTFAAQALATVGVLPLLDKVAYMRALLFPDAAYVADRHGSVVGRYLYAVRQVRRGRAAS